VETVARLAPGTWIEVHEGTVCVAARGAVTDLEALDVLAATASALAVGLRTTAAAMVTLAPGDTFPPARTRASIEAAAGAARIAWQEPPRSLAAAREAYESVARRPVKKAGRGLLRVLAGAATLASGAPIDGADGRSVASADQHRAHLWALTAFTTAYGASRGLHEVDRHEFRRRLPDAPPGIPLRVLRGPLTDRVDGWVALWIDKSDLARAPGYGILARADSGRTTFQTATPESITPEAIDAVKASAATDRRRAGLP
jgi:hypothetical protein